MSVPNPATENWVPLWDLNGGVKLDYKGSWAAGSYTDGDVVVHQGTTYMCVRPTSAAPVPWPLASGSASYGTSPPANPVDGQIWMLPVSAGIVWQFRYNAASTDPSGRKWEFIGGPAVYTDYVGSQPVSPGATWVAGAPQLTLPRSGVYLFSFSGTVHATSQAQALIGLWDVGIVGNTQAGCAGNGEMAMSRPNIPMALPAGGVMQLAYWVSVAATHFSMRFLSALPVAVA